MNKDKFIEVNINRGVSYEQIRSLLDSASRGSEYWSTNELGYESEVNKALSDDCIGTKILDNEDDDSDNEHMLNIKMIKKGIDIMANKYPKKFFDFLEGDYDMYTGDTFLQCCLFGEEIYG